MTATTLCQCGCGQPTTVVKGRPHRFISGHNPQPRKRVTLRCACGKRFEVRAYRANSAKFCSRTCRVRFFAPDYCSWVDDPQKVKPGIPVGLCQCGCGRKAPLARTNESAQGHVKGQPMRYCAGHSLASGKSDGERFWSRVEKTDGCWLWRGHCDRLGYGQFWLGPGHTSAHRAAWILTNGFIPDGLNVLHTCDNCRCVRPGHLFLGTHLDNMRDMVTKGRQRNRWTGKREAV